MLKESGLVPYDRKRRLVCHDALECGARGSRPGVRTSRAALEALCRTYWYPLYAYVRRQGYDEESAKDLIQEFFCRLIDRHYLEAVSREKGRFRSFLLASLKHFLNVARVRASALKRGGGADFRTTRGRERGRAFPAGAGAGPAA